MSPPPLDQELLRQRLHDTVVEFRAKHRLPNMEATAVALGVTKKNVERWRNGTLPTLPQLVTIARRTEVTLEWLTGAVDAPKRLGDLGPSRAAGEVVRERIEALSPSFEPRVEKVRKALGHPNAISSWRRLLTPLPESPSDVVEAVALRWLESDIVHLGQVLSGRLQELAVEMRRATAQDNAEREALEGFASRISAEASRFNVPSAIINTLDTVFQSGPLVAASNYLAGQGGGERYQTRFNVLGADLGYGLAWRGARRDDAWYLDESLNVVVKTGGRFLGKIPAREGTLAGLFARDEVLREQLFGRVELNASEPSASAIPRATAVSAILAAAERERRTSK